jgi:hypothetical protein
MAYKKIDSMKPWKDPSPLLIELLDALVVQGFVRIPKIGEEFVLDAAKQMANGERRTQFIELTKKVVEGRLRDVGELTRLFKL